MKIGYLIPEFPGQTHNFFWRERSELQTLGVQTSLLSTRRPPQGIESPDWACDAQQEVLYVLPLQFKDLPAILSVLFRSGPLGWWLCIQMISEASGLSLLQRLRLALILPLSAKLVAIAHLQGWRHVHVHSCSDAANLALLASLLSPEISYSLTLHNSINVYGSNQEQKWSHATFALVIRAC